MSWRSEAWLCLLGCLGPALAGETGLPAPEAVDLERLRRLSLEEIVNTEVTSVSKRPERLFESATAVSVISNDDIRRSGATSIAEALRLAPGLGVAQSDAHTWSVASRGFNDLFTDKLLVMVDGRSVYHNVNGSVWWNDVDYLLEDIERIEVIRGPGGTIWGANAVNGVINIITKSAKDSQGTFITGGGGTEERGFGAVRHGAKLAEDLYARAFVQYDDHAAYPGGNDQWSNVQGGARFDWEPAAYRVTLQGDYYSSTLNGRVAIPQLTPPYLPMSADRANHEGGNVVARLEREFHEDSELRLQVYYDHSRQHNETLQSLQETDNVDVDFQHRFPLPLNQSLTYGLEYRYLPTYQNDMALWSWNPNQRHSQLVTGFLQDEIDLVEDRLRLTAGVKAEHNDFTGWEYQPNARLSWLLTDRQTVWGAVSRAIAIPSVAFNDIRIPQLSVEPTMVPITPGGPTLPLFPGFYGNPDLVAQELLGYEVGYRLQLSDSLSFDLATFYNTYDDLVLGVPGTPEFVPSPAPHLTLPLNAESKASGETAGVELAANWRATDWCRLSAFYAFLHKELRGLNDQVLYDQEKDPANQASLRASFDLPHNVTLDFWGRFVDELPAYDVDAYFDLDIRLAWRPKPLLEIAVVGQNLIESERFEFGNNPAVHTQITPVPRGVYAQVSLRF